MQMGFVDSSAPAGAPFLPLYTSPNTNNLAPNSDSGITFNNAPRAARKRPQSSIDPVSFLGEDASSFLHQQLLDIDHLVLQHAEKLRAELLERRKRFLKQVLTAVSDGVSRRLRAKQEEVERAAKLNWALEERIKSLVVENQLWRELAQSNEATANVLRSNLEHVLAAAQVRVKEEDIAVAEAADDAESCCCGDNGDVSERESAKRRRLVCRSCGDGEPAVLVLPCRHLCLCTRCGPVVNVCPVCTSTKTGCLFVNMS